MKRFQLHMFCDFCGKDLVIDAQYRDNIEELTGWLDNDVYQFCCIECAERFRKMTLRKLAES